MKLVLLFGSAAVGKMTVGQALMEKTGLRLFHNHMTIEPVIEIFGYYSSPVTQQLREVIFREFAKSNNKGLIFTFMWAFNYREDWEYVSHVTDIFAQQGAEIYYAELVASQSVRLQRNETANRLTQKPSKRDISASRSRLLAEDEKYRLESLPGEIPFENYIRIDNTYLEPEEVALQICQAFGLA